MASPTKKGFCIGDQVEVCSKEDGFLGSYYEAVIVADMGNNLYVVQYECLLEDDDESQHLKEHVMADDIRPRPPLFAATLNFLDRVDAFHNCGWWVGTITQKRGSKYLVFFETTGKEIAFPDYFLRMHVEWINGTWLSSKKEPWVGASFI